MSAPGKQEELFHYVLIIKKENGRSIDLISILLCVISWIFFLYYSLRATRFLPLLFYGSFIIPLVLGWTEWIRRSFKKKTGFKSALFVTGVVWLMVPGFRWAIFIFLLFIVLDQQSRVPLEVGIGEKQIAINTFFRKRYLWSEFSNVVLKDNLLTLDFKNNRILQKEVSPLHPGWEEAEFNSFCETQLALAQQPGTS